MALKPHCAVREAALFWVLEAAQFGFEAAQCSAALSSFGFAKLHGAASEAAQCGLRSRAVRLRSHTTQICEATRWGLNSWYVTPDYTSGRGQPGNLIYRHTCKISRILATAKTSA